MKETRFTPCEALLKPKNTKKKGRRAAPASAGQFIIGYQETFELTSASCGAFFDAWLVAGADVMWRPISTAPFGTNLELYVIEWDVPYTLVFPCRRVLNGWVNAETLTPVDVNPTHWRPWTMTILERVDDGP